MSGRVFSLEDSGFAEVLEWAEELGPKGAEALKRYFADEAGPVIARRIDALMPVSGRRFRGHSSPARGSAWQRYTPEGAGIEVAASGARRYLYFPDDGTNTVRHAGNQQFFPRGAQAAAPDVAEGALDALIREWSNS